MSQHTPGPWELAINDECSVLHKTGDRTHRAVAVTCSIYFNGSKTPEREIEDKANARLIAASPTLYNFVKEEAGKRNVDAIKTLDLFGLSY